MNVFIVMLTLLFPWNLQADEQVCEIHITGIRSSEGQFVISAFQTEQGWKDEKPVKKIFVPKDKVRDGELICSMILPPGVYGIALLDDEDEDGQMRFSIIGYPKEGVGFSDYIYSALRKPRLEEFTFTMARQPRKVTIVMRYF